MLLFFKREHKDLLCSRISIVPVRNSIRGIEGNLCTIEYYAPSRSLIHCVLWNFTDINWKLSSLTIENSVLSRFVSSRLDCMLILLFRKNDPEKYGILLEERWALTCLKTTEIVTHWISVTVGACCSQNGTVLRKWNTPWMQNGISYAVFLPSLST